MNYNKTIWNTGDIIEANKLNNIETGIENLFNDKQEKIVLTYEDFHAEAATIEEHPVYLKTQEYFNKIQEQFPNNLTVWDNIIQRLLYKDNYGIYWTCYQISQMDKNDFKENPSEIPEYFIGVFNFKRQNGNGFYSNLLHEEDISEIEFGIDCDYPDESNEPDVFFFNNNQHNYQYKRNPIDSKQIEPFIFKLLINKNNDNTFSYNIDKNYQNFRIFKNNIISNFNGSSRAIAANTYFEKAINIFIPCLSCTYDDSTQTATFIFKEIIPNDNNLIYRYEVRLFPNSQSCSISYSENNGSNWTFIGDSGLYQDQEQTLFPEPTTNP